MGLLKTVCLSVLSEEQLSQDVARHAGCLCEKAAVIRWTVKGTPCTFILYPGNRVKCLLVLWCGTLSIRHWVNRVRCTIDSRVKNKAALISWSPGECVWRSDGLFLDVYKKRCDSTAVSLPECQWYISYMPLVVSTLDQVFREQLCYNWQFVKTNEMWDACIYKWEREPLILLIFCQVYECVNWLKQDLVRLIQQWSVVCTWHCKSDTAVKCCVHVTL